MTADDVSTVLGWWEMYLGSPVWSDMVPPRGFVATSGGEPVMGAWVARMEGMPVGMVDLLAAKPKTPMGLAKAAGQALMDHIEQHCKSTGISLLVATSNRLALCEYIQTFGFEPKASEMIHLFKNI